MYGNQYRKSKAMNLSQCCIIIWIETFLVKKKIPSYEHTKNKSIEGFKWNQIKNINMMFNDVFAQIFIPSFEKKKNFFMWLYSLNSNNLCVNLAALSSKKWLCFSRKEESKTFIVLSHHLSTKIQYIACAIRRDI